MKSIPNPLNWARSHVPRSQDQLETELKGIMKVAFWVAFLAPMIIVPAYYLVLTLAR